MTRDELWIGVPLAIIVAYPAVMRLLAEAVHPARLRLADLERQLLESGKLSARQARAVQSHMDAAFDPWRLARFAVRLPKFVFLQLLGRGPEPLPLPDGDVGPLFDRFMALSFVSAMAANPPFAVIVVVEALVLVPIEAFIEQWRRREYDEHTCRTAWHRNKSVAYANSSDQTNGFPPERGIWAMLENAALSVSFVALAR
jgi:hypothetical protein